MLKTLSILISIFIFAAGLLAQTEKPAWNVTLETNKTARSNLTVQNRCKKKHRFSIDLQNVPFLELSQNQVEVSGGKNVNVPVRFNTTNIRPNRYEGQVLVICQTCKSEPTCTQDRETLPVILNVSGGTSAPSVSTNQGNSNQNSTTGDTRTAGQNSATTDPNTNPWSLSPKNNPIALHKVKLKDNQDVVVPLPVDKANPCEQTCDDLRQIANDKEAAAIGAQEAADKAREPADAAEKAATVAEENAKNAAEAAKDDPSDYKARVNEQEYSSADVAYRIRLQAGINAAHAAGQISNAEHERQTKANTTKKAREERLKNKAKLKEEAKAAKAAAEAARAAANAAKAAADAAQKAADEAKKAAEDARKAYNDCVAKFAEECKKLKKLQQEAKEREAAAIRLAAEEKRREEAVRAEQIRQLEHDKYLIDNIKKLGLIGHKVVSDVPSLWQWLPSIMQVPVGMIAEYVGRTPIPTDVFVAMGKLYSAFGAFLNPCYANSGGRQTEFRLRKMINPKTGNLYTETEAAKKVEDMCKFLKNLKTRLAEVKRIQEGRK